MNTLSRVKIHHITPHLGAGVGTVVLHYLSRVVGGSHFTHSVSCLDYANENAVNIAKEKGFSLSGGMSEKKSQLLDLISESDAVLIHWWNHPLLYDFLIREELPASRIIFWSHISGFPPPNNFTDKTLKYPDVFVFTTPLSYEVGEVRALPPERRRRLYDVWSTGGLDRVKSVSPLKHSGFNVGYIGNVDYAKMHPDFLEMCDEVNIPEVKFIIVGGPNGKLMEQEAVGRGIAEKFEFAGFVTESEKWRYLSMFDVFGYPLAPHHYGTCDQTIQESMAAGVAPVVLANPMESHMVKNGETGIVARNKGEYVKALETLYSDGELREKLSANAKEYAARAFSLEHMINQWEKIFREVLKMPKTEKKWDLDGKKNLTPKDIFLESLGNYGKVFLSYCEAKNDRSKKNAANDIKKLAQSSANWRSKSKSTVHQYNVFLPGDAYLSVWSELMR